ncbi:MAG: sensor histidine kinase [Anaerolineae bacterium]
MLAREAGKQDAPGLNQAPTPISELIERMSAQVENAVLALGPAPPLLALRKLLEEMRQGLPEEAPAPAGESARLTALHAMLAQEEAGRRLAKQLEDTFGQLIANAIVEMDFAGRLLDSDPQAVQQGLQHLKEEFERARHILQEVLAGLRPPPLLSEMGLGPALSRYVQRLSAAAGRPIQVVGFQELPQRLPATAELALFRIMQEALDIFLTNPSSAPLEMGFKLEDQHFVFYVKDDAWGYGESALSNYASELCFMRDWALAIGGILNLWSRPGGGTIITAALPRAPEAPARSSDKERNP